MTVQHDIYIGSGRAVDGFMSRPAQNAGTCQGETDETKRTEEHLDAPAWAKTPLRRARAAVAGRMGLRATERQAQAQAALCMRSFGAPREAVMACMAADAVTVFVLGARE